MLEDSRITYKISGEYKLENDKNTYFKTDEDLILVVRSDVTAPYHPSINWKWSDKKFFDIVEEIPEGLERLIK